MLFRPGCDVSYIVDNSFTFSCHPWMTKGLLKSCRKKSNLYLKYIKNPNPTTKKTFITYRNKFKTVKIKAERNYYAAEFLKYNKDIKKTWSIIKSIVNSKTSDTIIESLSVNGQPITNSELIAEKFNNYFTGIAQNLSKKFLFQRARL
jgi:hypothetical protein